jgi:hypothetical protein
MDVRFLEGRQHLVDALRAELMGPVTQGTPIDCSGDISFDEEELAYGPFVQAGTGEEIVHRDRPVTRYGVGVLYPAGSRTGADGWTSSEAGVSPTRTTPAEEGLPDAEEELLAVQEGRAQVLGERVEQEIADRLEEVSSTSEPGPEELDLSGANLLRPSTIAVSLLAQLPPGSRLVVRASGGRYRRKTIAVKGTKRDWWLRSPVRVQASFEASTLLGRDGMVSPDHVQTEGCDGLDLRVEVRSRPRGGSTDLPADLLTVCLVNRSMLGSSIDEACVFQASFEALIEARDREPHIIAYPEVREASVDPEEASLRLLYRDLETFGVGHGCAADWDPPVDGRVASVRAEPFPAIETPSITPDVVHHGRPVAVPMAALAGLAADLDGLAMLAETIRAYREWIDEQRSTVPSLPPAMRQTAERHLGDCTTVADRMQEGLDLLGSDAVVEEAFRLANHAILLQQLRQQPTIRRPSYDGTRVSFPTRPAEPDPASPPPDRGTWRAFQVAFLLMALPSIVDTGHVDREVVELIWFPTGGGKTEAYLGLTAFAILLRRLRNPEDRGVEVMMRYTLRLLTAQQFQRASALMCALEVLRRANRDRLGDHPFQIGIWLGNTVTPGTRQEARECLRALLKDRGGARNMFLVLKCPWCSAQMGPVDYTGKAKGGPRVLGYEESGSTVRLCCPDQRCDFFDGLPILVIDEDIYDEPPSLLIGTVDKFAMLAWRSDTRAIFGIGRDGSRTASPPGLIIQDELHLISGPLGSMAGLYESVIEELCTDRRGGSALRPKIISSTATIRRFEEQIRALYARDRVTLFPPPGLSARDSFFARWALRADGTLAPGRLYVGVHATTLPSMMTTQVRSYASLLQGAADLPPDQRDPWWTLMVFYSSLRELGTGLTLFQADIPDYLITIRNRLSIPADQLRRVNRVEELTSRLTSDDVPKKISELEVTVDDERADVVDACLASSIVEVGIDIDRLSLMSIMSQPKTTSTYIQVTGRIGRRWWERPGLVVTLFSPQRPRDRSHFERFRSYHERLYAQVEPTSVTPFSPPALQRALHALMAAYVRQVGDAGRVASPYPIPQDLLEEFRALLLERLKHVEPSEQDEFDRLFAQRVQEWQGWERTEWGGFFVDEEDALLRSSLTFADPRHRLLSWLTPTSLRTVDAECMAEVTTRYAQLAGEDLG